MRADHCPPHVPGGCRSTDRKEVHSHQDESAVSWIGGQEEPYVFRQEQTVAALIIRA